MLQRAVDIRGMLLAEVMLAATLLLVVGLLLLGLLPTASQAMARSRKEGMAISISREELQKARCVKFADLANSLGPVSRSEILRGKTVSTTFQVQRRVTAISERVKKVEATVSWSESGLAYVRLTTLVRGEP